MSEISELILLLNKQHQEQMAVLRDEHREQNKQHQEQMAVLRDEHCEKNKQHKEQMTMLQEQLKTLQSSLNNPRENVPTPMASFQPFDSTSELWTDYLARFRTFVTANFIPDNKQAQIFLTNQSNSVYKMLSNLAAQQQPVKSIHELTMNDIQTFMAEQFDPKRFVVRERFKFWSDMKRKPGETIPELASRIRQDAATCDFQSIKDPLDEALKTLFKLKDDELKFSNAIRVAQEVEEAAKVAKETVHGQPSTSVITQSPKLPKRKKRKPPASGVEILDILAKLVPTLKLFAASARKQVICNLYALFHPSIKLLDLMTAELSLKLIAEPVTHFAVKQRGKRWVNPFYNLYLFNIKLLKVARYPSWDNSNQLPSIDGKSPDVTFPVIVTKVPNLNLLGRLAMMKLKLTNLT